MDHVPCSLSASSLSQIPPMPQTFHDTNDLCYFPLSSRSCPCPPPSPPQLPQTQTRPQRQQEFQLNLLLRATKAERERSPPAYVGFLLLGCGLYSSHAALNKQFIPHLAFSTEVSSFMFGSIKFSQKGKCPNVDPIALSKSDPLRLQRDYSFFSESDALAVTLITASSEAISLSPSSLTATTALDFSSDSLPPAALPPSSALK